MLQRKFPWRYGNFYSKEEITLSNVLFGRDFSLKLDLKQAGLIEKLYLTRCH